MLALFLTCNIAFAQDPPARYEEPSFLQCVEIAGATMAQYNFLTDGGVDVRVMLEPIDDTSMRFIGFWYSVQGKEQCDLREPIPTEGAFRGLDVKIWSLASPVIYVDIEGIDRPIYYRPDQSPRFIQTKQLLIKVE